MTRREKIIVAVMVLAILGGGYSFFFSAPSEPVIARPERGVGDLNKFVTDVAKGLNKNTLPEEVSYIFTQASGELAKDPFLASELTLTSEAVAEAPEEVVAEQVSFVYSGFLNMAHHKIAIIDGLEYETGDELGISGYYVKEISPVQVVIGVGEGEDELVLPLEEAE